MNWKYTKRYYCNNKEKIHAILLGKTTKIDKQNEEYICDCCVYSTGNDIQR